MPRRKTSERRPGQHGQYWLSKRSDSEIWQRTWYDASTRRTCRTPLGTADFQEAERLLALLVADEYRPSNADPADVPITTVMSIYFAEHARPWAGEVQAQIELGLWTAWWGDKRVSEVTPG